MTDHAFIAVIAVIGFSVQITGLVILGVLGARLGAMVREAQRLTRAVAGLVYQETDRLRQQLGGE